MPVEVPQLGGVVRVNEPKSAIPVGALDVLVLVLVGVDVWVCVVVAVTTGADALRTAESVGVAGSESEIEAMPALLTAAAEPEPLPPIADEQAARHASAPAAVIRSSGLGSATGV
jgi:hypothetical protein